MGYVIIGDVLGNRAVYYGTDGRMRYHADRSRIPPLIFSSIDAAQNWLGGDHSLKIITLDEFQIIRVMVS